MSAEVRPIRVLLIEDEPANRALVRAILARTDGSGLPPITLVEANTLGNGRAQLAAGDVDVALIDVRLPDGNGLDLASELGRRGPTDRPRTVIVSASVLPSERQTALATGADAFLGKPFNRADLVGTLLALIG
ncbi:MAG TPA: response regulator [Candidatus Limnocylindrales bacterium]